MEVMAMVNTKVYYVQFEHGDFVVDVKYTRTEYSPTDVDEEWEFQHPFTGEWCSDVHNIWDNWEFEDDATNYEFGKLLTRIEAILCDSAECEKIVSEILRGEKVINFSPYFPLVR